MRKTLRGYYRPTTEEFSDLWDHCLFVFDANVLLNLYRYSSKARDDLIDILHKMSDRIWIPHQAALEYQERRQTVIDQQESAYDNIKKMLIKLQKNVDKDIKSYETHPFIDTEHICGKIDNIIEEVVQELDSSKLDHSNLIGNVDLGETITNLFEGKVGPSYPFDKIEEIHKLGEKRYSRNIPPGYKDKSKPDMRGYGDLILWFQIIDNAKSIKKPIIFITDDRKEDWWQKLKGEIIGPQPKLINEMFSETDVNFYMYQPEMFMKYCWKYLEEKVNDEVLTEIREIRKQDEEDEKTKEMNAEQYRLLYQSIPAIAEQFRSLNQDIPAIAEQYRSLYQSIPNIAEQYRSLYQATPTFPLQQKRTQLEIEKEQNDSSE